MCESITEHLLKRQIGQPCDCEDEAPAQPINKAYSFDPLPKKLGSEMYGDLTKEPRLNKSEAYVLPRRARLTEELLSELIAEGRKDELQAEARRRHEAELLNPTQPYPRRVTTTTTKVEEEMPVSGLSGSTTSPQGYQDESGPSHLQAPFSVSPPFRSEGTATHKDDTAEEDADEGITPSKPILGLKENEETFTDELGRHIRGSKTEEGRIKREAPSTPIPGESVLVCGNDGLSCYQTRYHTEEAIEDLDLEKPRISIGQYGPQDLAHVTKPMLDADGTAPWPFSGERGFAQPPAKISVSPGRSGSSGVYRMSFHKLTNLITKSQRFEKSDGTHPYISGFVSDTSVDRDGDALTVRALSQLKRALDNDGISLFQDHTHELDFSLGTAVGSELRDMPDGNKGLWTEFRLEDPENNPKVAQLLNKLNAGERIGFSIGGDLSNSYMENGIRKLDDVTLYEVSAVAIPANAHSYVMGSVFKNKRCAA